MYNRYDPNHATTLTSALQMRVYTSQLLGQEADLVLHGGGNTSVKIDNVLYVKGSGWNLDTIEEAGFAPVDLQTLIAMASLETLSDSDMVTAQRAALQNPDAPNPSIEAILHAIIPFDFVDHTHADAVVTISNTLNGKARLHELYGENMLIVDYVMPGFLLAKTVFEMTRDIEWEALEGIILLNHGVFTFDNNAQNAYDKMIDIVSRAEAYLETHGRYELTCNPKEADPFMLDQLKRKVSTLRGCDVSISLLDTNEACELSNRENLAQILHSGGLTPEHVIRIKPFGMIVDDDPIDGIFEFTKAYSAYFNTYTTDHVQLDLAPRYGFIKGVGAIIFAKDEKEKKIISDIVEHTVKAMLQAETLGGWQSLNKAQLFAMEYWELEQAKLKK